MSNEKENNSRKFPNVYDAMRDEFKILNEMGDNEWTDEKVAELLFWIYDGGNYYMPTKKMEEVSHELIALRRALS